MIRLWVPLLVGTLASCGYAVVRGDSPFGVQRMAIIPFQEEESVGLSTELSRALATLLAADGVQIAVDPQTADGVITGVVLSERTQKSPVAAVGATVPAYRIVVTVRARLTDSKGRELWTTDVAIEDSFLPALVTGQADTRTLQTEANRRRALHRLAADAAHRIHRRLIVQSSVAQTGAD